MKYLQIIIRVFIILVAFLLNAVNVFGEVSSAFKPGNEDRILILNAYSGSSRWSNDFIIPIYNSYQHKNSPYVVDVEHMGSQFMHLQNAEELLEYEEGLFGKYADNPPKLLILLGSASWGLLRDDIEKKWKDVPVILCTETDYVGPQEAYLEIADSVSTQGAVSVYLVYHFAWHRLPEFPLNLMHLSGHRSIVKSLFGYAYIHRWRKYREGSW